MSLRVFIDRIEISIWDRLILLMSESELLQETLPKLYQVYKSLPVSNLYLLFAIFCIAGYGIGFALRGIASMLW